MPRARQGLVVSLAPVRCGSDAARRRADLKNPGLCMVERVLKGFAIANPLGEGGVIPAAAAIAIALSRAIDPPATAMPNRSAA